jgi:outer membrane lipoprotein SlyB
LSGDTSGRIAYSGIRLQKRMILLSQFLKFGLALAALATLTGCAPDYSPDTYNAGAVQQANKADPGVVVGFRQVSISAAGTVGAVTGGAAGGILGAQAGPTSAASALGAVGGGVVGSLLGTSIEHATADTIGWEYIVQKPNGDLLSVTQREPTPIPLGQKVLVIAGNQARIIPDYRVITELPTPAKDKPEEKAKAEEKAKPAAAPEAPAEPTPTVVAAPAAPAVPVIAATPLAPPDATGTPIPPAPAEIAPAPTALSSSSQTHAPAPIDPAPIPVAPEGSALSPEPAAPPS